MVSGGKHSHKTEPKKQVAIDPKKAAESKEPWDYYKILATIPGDQAFRPLAEGGCPLVAH